MIEVNLSWIIVLTGSLSVVLAYITVMNHIHEGVAEKNKTFSTLEGNTVQDSLFVPRDRRFKEAFLPDFEFEIDEVVVEHRRNFWHSDEKRKLLAKYIPWRKLEYQTTIKLTAHNITPSLDPYDLCLHCDFLPVAERYDTELKKIRSNNPHSQILQITKSDTAQYELLLNCEDYQEIKSAIDGIYRVFCTTYIRSKKIRSETYTGEDVQEFKSNYNELREYMDHNSNFPEEIEQEFIERGEPVLEVLEELAELKRENTKLARKKQFLEAETLSLMEDHLEDVLIEKFDVDEGTISNYSYQEMETLLGEIVARRELDWSDGKIEDIDDDEIFEKVAEEYEKEESSTPN